MEKDGICWEKGIDSILMLVSVSLFILVSGLTKVTALSFALGLWNWSLKQVCWSHSEESESVERYLL